MQDCGAIAKRADKDLNVKGLLLCAISLMILGSCTASSSSDKIAEFLSSSRKSREKGDIETAIPAIKMACELASSATGNDSRLQELQKKTYDEAIEVADSLNGFGHVKPARDVLQNAAKLEKICGISASDVRSASRKIQNLAEAELHESQIFEDAALSKKTSIVTDDSFIARKKTMAEIWTLTEKRQFDAAEKLARELMASRKKLVDYTSDQGFREGLDALKVIYSAQDRYSEIEKLYTQDAEMQKRGLTKTDLEQADPAAFFKARNYAFDMIEVATAQARLGHYDRARRSISTAEDLLRKIGKTTELLPCLSVKAAILEHLDDYETALRYRTECKRIMSNDTQTPATAFIECSQRIASDLEQLCRWQEAIQAYDPIYDLVKKHPLKIELAPTFMLEGAILAQRAKDYTNVTLFLNRAKELAGMKRPTYAMGSYYSVLGYFNREGGRYTDAIRDFKTAIAYFEKTSNLDWRKHSRDTLPAIALAYSLQERHAEALKEMEQFLKSDNPRSLNEKKEHMRNMAAYADMTRAAGLTVKSYQRYLDTIAYLEQLPTLPGDAPHQYYKAAYQAKRFEQATNSKCSGAECESAKLARKSIDAMRQLHPTPSAMAHAYFKIGVMYFEFDELNTANMYLKTSLSEFQKAKSKGDSPELRKGESACLKYLGVIECRFDKDAERAKNTLTKAINLIDGKQNRTTQLWNLIAMSDVYEDMAASKHEQKFLEGSDKYCREACDLIGKTPYKFEYSLALVERAQINIKLSNWDDAEKYLLELDQVVNSDHLARNTPQLAISKALQAHIALKKKNIQKTHKLLKEGIAEIGSLMRHKPPIDCQVPIIALARVCRKAGLTSESAQLQQVLQTLLKTLPMSEKAIKKRLADCADNGDF